MFSSSVRLGPLDPEGRKVIDARGFARNAHVMLTLLQFARLVEQAAPIKIVEALKVLCLMAVFWVPIVNSDLSWNSLALRYST